MHRYELPPARAGGRGRVRWRVNYELPPHPDGRRRRGTKKGFATKAEAKAWEDDLHGRVAAGETITYGTDKKSVGVYLRSWYAGVGGKATTRAHYRDMCEWYLIPTLGGIALEKLTAEQVDACYRWLEQHGGRKGQGLSPKTVRNVHVVLRGALTVAEQRGYVRRNVAALSHPPSEKAAKSRSAERVWTAEQINRWLTWLEQRGNRLWPVWRLIATTGLRRGEACGLHWADVDLDEGALRVRWELTEVHNELVWVDGAKTRAGERTVDLDERTVAVLRTHHARLSQEKLVCGPAYQTTCPCPQRHTPEDGIPLVVCGWDGRALHPGSLLRAVWRHAEALGLPPMTVHGLRHSYATVWLEAGGRADVLQERLGHASAATTMDIYAHVSRDAHRQAAEDTARRITG